jgi:transposase
MILDAKLVTVEPGTKSFDLIVKLSCLSKGHRIIIPTRKNRVINKWLSVAGAKIIHGLCIGPDLKTVRMWVDVPDPIPATKPLKPRVLGIDIGKNKMVVDSSHKFYGTEFSVLCKKIQRKRPGSRAKQKAFKERTNYINQTLNLIPWQQIDVLGIEALSDMKRGKQKNRSKNFRKALAPWTYRLVINRMGHKAQENSVCLVPVPPAYSSQTCPACNKVSRLNRSGENFKCITCGYTEDADFVGALNVLARTEQKLGRVESPRLIKEPVNNC